MLQGPRAVRPAQAAKSVFGCVLLRLPKGAKAVVDGGRQELRFAAEERVDRRGGGVCGCGNIAESDTRGAFPVHELCGYLQESLLYQLIMNDGSCHVSKCFITLFHNNVMKPGNREFPVPHQRSDMAQEIFPGRFTADIGRETMTVFLIGMRANRWWKMGKVARVASAMPTMMRHLAANPDAGLLGSEQWFGRTTILLSYWESPEHLRRFAADRESPHLGPWRKFMKEISGSGDIGVWHETYQVPASGIEVVYNGMPLFGLAKATSHVPVGPGSNTAKQRMGSAARGSKAS